LLNSQLEERLQICSEISFVSYDTEALNKQLDVIPDDINFENIFQNENHDKIVHGVQQLYMIGLFDILPIQKILTILEKHLPLRLFTKLSKYISQNIFTITTHIDWSEFYSVIKQKDLSECAVDLQHLLKNIQPNQNNVQTFHIENNLNGNTYSEPTHATTTTMVYHFLCCIYKRNIVCSLIKYILLKELIIKLEQCSITQSNKGIFCLMQKRITEILFECVLLAFNGSNYDNYLLCNHLILILTNLNHKIRIFKKGSSISTICITVKKNFNSFDNIFENKKIAKKNNKQKRVKKNKNIWSMVLFIKDIRNMVSSSMTLDKVGKLFNLNVSKLVFPYEQAKSIDLLRTLTSLHPYDDMFWQDHFSSRQITLETRLEAQQLFDSQHFNNLYEYSNYYLIQDCLLLHSIVLTLFKTYLDDSINIFIRRNYSQSNLAYQQFFIIEPASQIDQILAPKKISNSFCNYFSKLAVTGGLCTSFVHGFIDEKTIINEHLNYTSTLLNDTTWPNFKNINYSNKPFVEHPAGISTIDIRSLYPSATVKKIPVGSPLIYSRFTNADANFIPAHSSSILVKDFCQNVRTYGNQQTDVFKLLNKPLQFNSEYNALKWYLNSLSKNLIIIRFQSNFTALGQFYFSHYPVDGFLVYKEPLEPDQLYIKIIQYNSVYRHGHSSICQTINDEEQKILQEKTIKVKHCIQNLVVDYKKTFNLTNVHFEYVEISDCQFTHHKLPIIEPIIFPYKKTYSYNTFLNDILENKLTGYIVVKNLEIKKTQQNPIFGFIIQKVEYELKHLSDYTQRQLSRFCSSQRVISVHSSAKFMVISTAYFNWLSKTFGFEQIPDIYHAMLFTMKPYLTSHIESKLFLRKQIKENIKNEKNPDVKQILEIKAELIKLMLNSCYGFTLCNLTSSKFKSFVNRVCIPKHINRRKNILSCIKLAPYVFLAELKKPIQEPFETMLGHVGCTILFNSKIILLKRLLFLLQFLNPTKSQLLYMDTDSAHFLVKHKEFKDNVDLQIRDKFEILFDKHFETGQKISGIWVQEGFFESAQYIGEKCYVLYDKKNNNNVSHMKGCNTHFQKVFIEENINIKQTPHISYNIFYKSSDFAIFKTYMNKDLFTNYVPIKRYFVSPSGSLPLKIWK